MGVETAEEGVKFSIDQCHIHFKCGCNKNADLCLLNGEIEITVLGHCPTRPNKKAEMLVIGQNCMENVTCPNPNCPCNQTSTKMPLAEFQYMLKNLVDDEEESSDEE